MLHLKHHETIKNMFKKETEDYVKELETKVHPKVRNHGIADSSFAALVSDLQTQQEGKRNQSMKTPAQSLLGS